MGRGEGTAVAEPGARHRLTLTKAAPWLLVALALGLRLFRIPELTVFQGDQGVDALAARAFVVEGVLPVEGPATSAGGVHLGPLYYYLLALPMLFGGFDPLVHAVGVAALGACAVGLLYWLVRAWFGVLPAVMAAGLYALSPAVTNAARSAWNPAPAPFFLLLGVAGLARCHRSGDPRWLVLSGAALGCLIQFHYFTLAVVLVCFGFGAYEAVRARRLIFLGGAVAIFVVLLSPLLVHEVLYGLPNLSAAGGLSATASESLPRRAYAVLVPSLIGAFIAGGLEVLAVVLTVVLLSALVLRRSFATVLLLCLLGATLVQALLYRGPLFEHYFVPLAPLVFLAFGAIPARFGALLAVPLLAVSVWQSPMRDDPLHHLARTEAVAAAIAQQAGGEPFAIWLVAPDDKDGAYRYQLARLGLRPASPSEALPRQLYVICQQSACDPRQLQASVGQDWANATQSWQATFYNVTVVRLSTALN